MRNRRMFTMLITMGAIGAGVVVNAFQQDPDRERVLRRAHNEQARYRSLDRNDDGIISRREWRGSALTFRQLDTDGNGELAGREIWFRLPSDSAAYSEEDQRREDMIHTFYAADADNDGVVTRREWWDARQVFARVDTNRDNVVTLGEFIYTDAAVDVPTGTSGETPRQSQAYQNGFERGLVDGRHAGREDKTLRNRWDFEGQQELEQADAGYRNELGRRDEYQAGYRAGFRRGYREGFGPR